MGWRSASRLSATPPDPRAIGARSTIDEVRDRLRIMGGLPKIRTPGTKTGRCARLGIKIMTRRNQNSPGRLSA